MKHVLSPSQALHGNRQANAVAKRIIITLFTDFPNVEYQLDQF